MLSRKQHSWKVRLQRSNGSVTTRTVSTFWDPAYEHANERAGNCAAAIESYVSKVPCVFVGVELVS